MHFIRRKMIEAGMRAMVSANPEASDAQSHVEEIHAEKKQDQTEDHANTADSATTV